MFDRILQSECRVNFTIEEATTVLRYLRETCPHKFINTINKLEFGLKNGVEAQFDKMKEDFLLDILDHDSEEDTQDFLPMLEPDTTPIGPPDDKSCQGELDAA